MKGNDDNTKWIGASLLTAVGASLCCVAPVFAVLAGISGLAFVFSWVEPIRPYLIGLTIFFLGLAWHHKLKSGSKLSSEKENSSSFLGSKLFLGIATGLIGLLLAFPYYSDVLFSQIKDQASSLPENQIETVTIEIQGMTCGGCETAVEQAVKRVEGIIEAKAFSKTGTAMVKFVPGKTNQNILINTVNATGLKVSAIHSLESTIQNRNLDEITAGSFCSLQGDGTCTASCPTASGCTKDNLEAYLMNQDTIDPKEMTVISLNGSVEALKNRFNEGRGHPRFMAVLSPVCHWCLDGAQKIKETILEKTGGTDFRLYIVWIDMLEDDNFSTAQKAATLLNNPHVYHFYEGSESLSRTIARTLTGNEGVAWDIYMFYGKDITWDQSFPVPSDYVHQLNPQYFPWTDSTTFSFGPELTEKFREYSASYSAQ